MHGIFWMVIGHSESGTLSPTCYRGTQPHLDGNRRLWYILLRYSATTVTYGIYIYIHFFWATPACVWCFDASTFTEEHENHQTSNLNMTYCTPENTIKGSVQITIKGRHSQPTVVCVCVFFPCILDVKFVGSTCRVTQDFSSIFLLRCVPLFFPREGFSRSFPSSTVKLI